MASPTKKTETRRKVRNAKLLKNRQRKLRRAQARKNSKKK